MSSSSAFARFHANPGHVFSETEVILDPSEEVLARREAGAVNLDHRHKLLGLVPADPGEELRGQHLEAALPIDERFVEVNEKQAVATRHGTPTLPATRTAPRRATPKGSR